MVAGGWSMRMSQHKSEKDKKTFYLEHFLISFLIYFYINITTDTNNIQQKYKKEI